MRSFRFNFMRSGFTLIELLVVCAIVSMLATLLLPVFWTARGQARQMVCAANLHQIGGAIAMYRQDYDGLFPRAVDATDRAAPHTLWRFSDFARDIPRLPMLQDALLPYTSNTKIFSCPSDIGFDVPDYTYVGLNAFPSSFQKFGSSYAYRTALAASRANDASLSLPTQVNLMHDPVGFWHGRLTPIVARYNVLFADSHVKNLTRAQLDEAWEVPIYNRD